MTTVFPVELLVQERLFQAFTRDVSAGGMRLEIKVFDRHFEQSLERTDIRLGLTINPTFSRQPIKATARVAWMQKKDGPIPRVLIGVAYTDIEEIARRRLIRHAQWLLWLPRAVWTAGVALVACLAALTVHDRMLVLENQKLVAQIVDSASKKSDVTSQLYELQRRKTLLDAEVERAREKIHKLETAMTARGAQDEGRQALYQKELTDIVSRSEGIRREIDTLQSNRRKLQSSYQALREKSRALETTALKQMVDWLESHQNFHTGLVASYEGDDKLKDIAFTYDQALAVQAYLLFGHLKNAEAILDFFEKRAAKSDGGYFNAYDAVDGRSAENAVNVGPNIWIGISALQFDHLSAKGGSLSAGQAGASGEKSGRFLPLARRLGDWALGLQDEEGGLAGGPSVDWYSTEHNLDAYAFFSMLYDETRDDRYSAARDRSLEWIQKYAYSATQGRLNRGKGDSTIATDTFSWALAAIGPARLKSLDFDPEAIMAFAEDHCAVTVDFRRPDGKVVSVKGFDFARAQNIGRGGVISTEWTAQMTVSYRLLARYFQSVGNEAKATLYTSKSDFYLSELQKMIITSPSKTGQGRGCLPYASHDNVDTGHGWRSPKGQSTGSVAGTAYTVFAWNDYNPFDLTSLDSKK